MKSLVFVGGFHNTIEVFALTADSDGNDVNLSYLGSCQTDDNPSFLDISGDRLYCVHEVGNYKGQNSGGMSFMKVEGSKLLKLHFQYSSGEDPTHIRIDNTYNCIYVANYGSGHFSVTKLKDTGFFGGGLYIESYDVGSGVDAKRQDIAHPHGTCTKGRFVYVTDLGSDKIWHYEHGARSGLYPADPDSTNAPPGSGPRHMVFHPEHDIAFVLTELSNEIIVYRMSNTNGSLTRLKSYKYLNNSENNEENFGAEIMIHPNGQFLYISNRCATKRGNASLISFSIGGGSGDLVHNETVTLKGSWPRHFNIHSSGRLLICTDQFKETLDIFHIQSNTGKLKLVKNVECKNKPSCVVFKDLDWS